ncbi:hypothetical protein DFH07DRAFT_1058127 [Mycena maculata]|uniref:Uncharacterized protein n=1 Tax=Mycena maculata TaxID=230809 RepID=A0AAD7NPF5_9AGAR|nr:hypothetical protein DFH07DRAFT_1058127 [Mycena maculata]
MVQYLSPDKAGLLSTVLESILYGFSVLMFIGVLWTLLRGRTWAEVNRPMITVACLLFILSTIHLGVDINRLNSGFIRFRDTYPGGPVAWFANPSDPSFVFKNAVYSFQTVLGDGVVIYRCYMVWRTPWIIVIPCVMWLGVATAAAGSVYSCTLPSTLDNDIYARQLGKWITSFYSMTVSCNLIATALLSYRLWTVNRNANNSRVGKGLTIPALLVVIDAGALYSFTILAALICFALESNGQYVVLDMVTPIISIAFYMVILRIGIAQNIRFRGNTTHSTHPRLPIARSDMSRSDVSDRLKSMQVRIQVEEATDTMRRADDKAEEAEDHRMEPLQPGTY